MTERVEPRLRRAAIASRNGALRPRWLGALLIETAGALHLYLWFDFFHRVHVIGPLFLANAAVADLIAVALAARSGVITLVAGLGYSLGTLAAFAISTRWSLFGYHERFWGRWQASAGVVELLAALLLLAELARSARGSRRA